jgi:ubiquinone/menaquinone biosynthesis C-methylase UbiE
VSPTDATRLWTPRVYDRIARYYDFFSDTVFRTPRHGRERALRDLCRGTILDVACGTGSLLSLASQRGMTCCGVDNSSGMLDQARSKLPAARLIKGSYYELPFDNLCFDYVVATHAISGSGIDHRRIVREMIRVCRQGGEVRIVDMGIPEEQSWQYRLTARAGAWFGDVPRDYLSLFRELGYEPELEHLGGFGSYQYLSITRS